jgi:hypothetical protein
MDLLLLSGNSARNKSWIYSVRDTLTPLFVTSLVHDYAHWENGETFINFDQELVSLPREVTILSEHIVFAKSVGSVLVAQAIHNKLLNPQQCIFVGLPLELIEKQQYAFADWLRGYHKQITFIQNAHDPLGSYEAVKSYLHESGLDQCLCIEFPGDTHDYNDYPRLRQVVSILVQDR